MFFQLYSPTASDIGLRPVIFAMRVILRSAQLKGEYNITALKRQYNCYRRRQYHSISDLPGLLQAKGLKNSHFYAILIGEKENDKLRFEEVKNDRLYG